MDSFAGGHPGMPQDCSKWESNQIYSNNADLFNDKRDAYCKNTPIEKRDPRKVCPTFQVPVGTGILTGGGNGNIFRDNWIYDNWRRGTMLFWVPGELRGERPDRPVGDRAHRTRRRTTTSTSATGWASGPTAAATPTASTSGGTRRAAATAGRATRARAAARSRATRLRCSRCPERQPRHAPAAPRSRRELFAVRDVGPERRTPDPLGCDWFTRPPEPTVVRARQGWPLAAVVALAALAPLALRRRRRRRQRRPASGSSEPTIVRQRDPAARPRAGRVRAQRLAARGSRSRPTDVRAVDEDGDALRGNATFVRGVHPSALPADASAGRRAARVGARPARPARAPRAGQDDAAERGLAAARRATSRRCGSTTACGLAFDPRTS